MERGTVRLDQQLEFHEKCDNVCGQFLKNQYYFRVEQHPVIDYKRLECSQVELEQYVEFHKKYNDFFCQQLKIQHHFRLEQHQKQYFQQHVQSEAHRVFSYGQSAIHGLFRCVQHQEQFPVIKQHRVFRLQLGT